MIKKMLLILLLLIKPAMANISVFPYSVEFDALSNKRVKSVRIINTSEHTQTYRVSVVNFLQDKNGKLTEVKDDNGTFAQKYLNWSPRQFTLKPNEIQTINVARRSMATAPDGEFVSHLKIAEVSLGKPKSAQNTNADGTLSMQIKALFAVTIPVTVTKGENLLAKTEIGKVNYANNNLLQVELKRLGNKSSRVNLAVMDAKGKEIGRLNNVKVYLSTPTLNIKVPLKTKERIKNLVLRLEDAGTKEEILKQSINL
ncbi:MAG: hypothetical protein J6B00_01505 [Alphaproteobacteria bacterium]|nr:hypothetical protein [Alphaproteobacteria bacterium]